MNEAYITCPCSSFSFSIRDSPKSYSKHIVTEIVQPNIEKKSERTEYSNEEKER
jgi:hypothetical protein